MVDVIGWRLDDVVALIKGLRAVKFVWKFYLLVKGPRRDCNVDP